MAKLNTEQVRRDLGVRIRELRLSRRITQARFLELGGWKHAESIRQIESGANLTVESLVRIANLLDVGLCELFAAPRSHERSLGRPPTGRSPRKRRKPSSE